MFSPETRYLAGSAVRHALAAAGNDAAIAVDGGVVLYPPSNQRFDLDRIETQVDAPNRQPSNLSHPEPDAVRSAVLLDVADEPVREYLLELVPTRKVDDEFRVKVALRDIRWPVERIETPLRLTISPLSYWIVQHFNRRMVRVMASDERQETERMLISLRNRALEGILAPGQDLSIRCPSPLYVEVALVTSDNYLVCLTKDAKHSIYATTGRRWTCSVEEGAEWSDVSDGRLDFDSVARNGARKELSITKNEILTTWFDAIVLEYPNLSTAIIGTMMLSIPKSELPRRVARSPDFEDVQFVHLSEATKAIFGPKPVLGRGNGWWDEGSWHPTARLRVLFSLYRHFGKDDVLRQVERYSRRGFNLRRSGRLGKRQSYDA